MLACSTRANGASPSAARASDRLSRAATASPRAAASAAARAAAWYPSAPLPEEAAAR